MKKTIFDLSFAEGKKVDSELKKTSYFKQYLNGYTLITAILVFFGSFVLGYFSGTENVSVEAFALLFGILIGFLALLTLLFWFKRFDLVKKYYEEKYSKEQK